VVTVPTTIERPKNATDAARVLKDTRGAVLFRGGGTKMSWGGRPPVEPAVVLETGGMARLLTHNPADMTVAVEAGIPLRTLQALLAGSGQWLALDPPTEPAGATIGGLLATGESGPRRLRYGALRDLVIGVTLVLADGTVARAGGQVIKNVAGYDLSKFSYGSLGTLGLVAEVVLRVHPRPEASATVVAAATVGEAAARTLELLASPLEPAAVDWTGDPRQGGRLAVRFEGSRAGVEARTVALEKLLPGAEVLTGAGETALWDEFATAHRGEPGESVAFAGTLPSRLAAVAAALTQAGAAAVVDTRLASNTALGLHTARFAGPPKQQAGAFERWRDAVRSLGGTVLLRECPPDVDATVDPLGPPPSSVGLLRAVKSRLDPDGRCAPGRLRSWLDEGAGRTREEHP
jgi:glycolate oxidase FAD binding subunit